MKKELLLPVLSSLLDPPPLLLSVAEEEDGDHDYADHSQAQTDHHELVNLGFLDAWIQDRESGCYLKLLVYTKYVYT